MNSVDGRLRVAVAGATGYIGMQCVELLAAHPRVEITRLLARTATGRSFNEVVPGSTVDLPVEAGLDPGDADVVLAALPHTVAASHAAGWLARGAVVIDMSADFRLRDAAVYERWYGVDHPARALCEEALYAVPELAGEALRHADLIALPGCYATAALLATMPAVAAGLVELDIVVDAKSGVSGSGRSPSLANLFGEVNESVTAYSVEGHRHKAELRQELELAAGERIRLTFVPHLVAMTRGLLATVYLRPRPGVGPEELRAAYANLCRDRPCLRLCGSPPPTKSVVGTNLAALHVGWQEGTAVVSCALDNLLKGAGGQGVQALNIRFGFAETTGLPLRSRWP